jgi:hypothetical protein
MRSLLPLFITTFFHKVVTNLGVSRNHFVTTITSLWRKPDKTMGENRQKALQNKAKSPKNGVLRYVLQGNVFFWVIVVTVVTWAFFPLLPLLPLFKRIGIYIGRKYICKYFSLNTTSYPFRPSFGSNFRADNTTYQAMTGA